MRELVSNSSDAIAKYKRLLDLGEAAGSPDESFRMDVIYDKDAGTLAFCDNGIGMTADEVDKYINQIAFSGAMKDGLHFFVIKIHLRNLYGII